MDTTVRSVTLDASIYLVDFGDQHQYAVRFY